MIGTFSHYAPAMSYQDVLALVYRPVAEVRNPSAASEAHASCPFVTAIGLVRHTAEIAQSVIKRIAVDMVDIFRLLVVSKEPSDPVVVELDASNSDGHGVLLDCSSFFAAKPIYPVEMSSFWFIAQFIAHKIWDNFVSHVVPPYDVVRGLVVRATSTPILPIVSTISKEFAVSGGNSRGTYGLPPCFNYPTPL
jgi:hypothetical protein